MNKPFFDFASNYDSVDDRIMGVTDALDMTAEGLAEDIQGIIADAQIARAAAQMDPMGSPWTENAPSTLRRKGGKPVGVDTGEMLDADNIRGSIVTDKHSFVVMYSGSDYARFKLEMFEAGGRVFWGMDDAMKAAIVDRCGEELREYMHGGGA